MFVSLLQKNHILQCLKYFVRSKMFHHILLYYLILKELFDLHKLKLLLMYRHHKVDFLQCLNRFVLTKKFHCILLLHLYLQFLYIHQNINQLFEFLLHQDDLILQCLNRFVLTKKFHCILLLHLKPNHCILQNIEPHQKLHWLQLHLHL